MVLATQKHAMWRARFELGKSQDRPVKPVQASPVMGLVAGQPLPPVHVQDPVSHAHVAPEG